MNDSVILNIIGEPLECKGVTEAVKMGVAWNKIISKNECDAHIHLYVKRFTVLNK